MIREIYINKNVPVAPIQWVFGTDGLEVEIEVMDFDMNSVSSIKFYALTNTEKRYSADGAKNGQIVSFKPAAGFFAVGYNSLQCEMVASSGTVYTFSIPVYCEVNNRFAGEERDLEAIRNYVDQINANAAAIARLQSASGEGVSLESLGAVGDGVTDDSDAIRSALLADIDTIEGDPNKTYFLGSNISVSNVSKTIKGCKFVFANNLDYSNKRYKFHFQNSDVTFVDCSFSSTIADNKISADYAINVRSCRLDVVRCHFENCDCIVADTASDVTVLSSSATNTTTIIAATGFCNLTFDTVNAVMVGREEDDHPHAFYVHDFETFTARNITITENPNIGGVTSDHLHFHTPTPSDRYRDKWALFENLKMRVRTTISQCNTRNLHIIHGDIESDGEELFYMKNGCRTILEDTKIVCNGTSQTAQMFGVSDFGAGVYELTNCHIITGMRRIINGKAGATLKDVTIEYTGAGVGIRAASASTNEGYNLADIYLYNCVLKTATATGCESLLSDAGRTMHHNTVIINTVAGGWTSKMSMVNKIGYMADCFCVAENDFFTSKPLYATIHGRRLGADGNITRFMYSPTKSENGEEGAGSGGGLSEDDVNALIDAKLNPIEALADEIGGIVG